LVEQLKVERKLISWALIRVKTSLARWGAQAWRVILFRTESMASIGTPQKGIAPIATFQEQLTKSVPR
jgi:hypothetical protein